MSPRGIRAGLGARVLSTVDRVRDRCRPRVVVLDNPSESAAVATMLARLPFYLPGRRVRVCRLGQTSGWNGLAWRWAGWRQAPVLYAGQLDIRQAPGALRHNPCYWLNPFANSREAWEWHELVQHQTRQQPDVAAAQARFVAFVERRQLRRLPRAYVFGTGPSLDRARDRQWSDGARIVCNTIVRDRDLWHHLDPHMIVAADAGYHFSDVSHARAFRADLRARLGETDTLFLYPAEFDAVVRRELAGFSRCLVPVPHARITTVHHDLTRHFAFPQLHNVLPRLLTVACSLSDDIGLWGFDGRAPQDTGFWQNANRQAYPEHMEDLRRAYPAFFEELVPARDQQRYTRFAFGDELESCLAAAESAGKRLVMLHPTWTETLRRRCPPALQHPPSGDQKK